MVSVTWDAAAFSKAKVVGREGAMMEFRATGDVDPDTVVRAFGAAVAEANEVLAAQEAAGRELYGLVETITRGTNGPIATFKECEPVAALRMFLTSVVDGLESREVGGALVPLPPHEIDRWFGNNAFSALTGLLLLTVDRDGVLASYDTYSHQPTLDWWVASEITDIVLPHLLDWVLDGGRQVDLKHGPGRVPATHDTVRLLARQGVDSGRPVHVLTKDGPRRMRQMRLNHFGEVIIAEYAPEVPIESQYDSMLGLLTRVGRHLTTGWLQEAQTHVRDRTGILARTPPIHPLADSVRNMPWRLFHLEQQHVYDAFVAQVLTSEQLARTTLDSARWEVSPVGNGRHLVTHHQPELWLHQERDWEPLPQGPYDRAALVVSPVPNQVLAQARSDFGDAIMSVATYRQHPFVEPGTGEKFGPRVST